MCQEIDKAKILQCACCGSRCWGRQWWNRDRGYGLCWKCVPVVLRGYVKGYKEEGVSQFQQDYGRDTVHFYSAKGMSEVDDDD